MSNLFAYLDDPGMISAHNGPARHPVAAGPVTAASQPVANIVVDKPALHRDTVDINTSGTSSRKRRAPGGNELRQMREEVVKRSKLILTTLLKNVDDLNCEQIAKAKLISTIEAENAMAIVERNAAKIALDKANEIFNSTTSNLEKEKICLDNANAEIEYLMSDIVKVQEDIVMDENAMRDR